jgi:hypothetical protein
MPSSPPFVDRATGTIDTDELVVEAVPLAKLILLFLAIAAVPLLVVFFVGGPSPLGAVLTVVAQFVLAVGTGIVLMYVIARAIQLADG